LTFTWFALRALFHGRKGLLTFMVEAVMKWIGGTWRSIAEELPLARVQIDPHGLSLLLCTNGRSF
jgi:hypothetical protein